MTTGKRYEILEGLPTYGPMYITVPENGESRYSEGLAVRFFKSDGTEWIANFERGWTNLTAVLELRGSPNLLIIAFGTCYLMDPDETKPLAAFGDGYSKVFHAKDGRFILQDQDDFTIVENDGTYWYTESIADDGLKNVELTNNVISGLACYLSASGEEEWNRFSYNIDTRKLTH